MFNPDEVRIYHNTRCSKSRKTLELLSQHGVQPRIINFLETPPSAAELSALLDMLGLTPRELMRTNEEEYAAAHLDDSGLDREALIQAMIRYPKIIERPIVVSKGKAAIGRPPENVL